MGAENSVLDNCEWGETVSADFWKIKNGTLIDGSGISLFTTDKSSKKHVDLLRKLSKRLKSIRHPCILHYISFEEQFDGPCMVTEQVVPLVSVVSKLSAIEICAGIHSILDGLAFLHDKVGLCHNNVCQQVIYVCNDGSWRLGGLEHSCRVSEATSAYLESCRAYRAEGAISPEEKQGQLPTGEECCHSRDVFAFAVLVEELLEKLADLGDMTKTFELRIQDECLSSNPKDRPTMQSLLNDRLFTAEFLEIASFLKNIALHGDDKRKEFFRNLLPKLLSLPEELIGRRLVPLLLSRFVLLDQSAVTYILPHVLTPSPDDISDNAPACQETTLLFTESLYRRFIVPRLVKIFSVHDHHIRMILLQYFHTYVHLIDRDDLEAEVFPQILLGLRDASDVLAAASLRALADLVPILGRDVVIGGKSKKYFKEGMPNVPLPELLNNKLSNVQGIMGKKVLLKDLAVYSKDGKSPTKTADGKERKDKNWKERERRKAEMRLRREQRRTSRENRASGERRISTGAEKPPSTEVIPSDIPDVNSPDVTNQIPDSKVSANDNNSESETLESKNKSEADDKHMICNTKTGWSDDRDLSSNDESDWSKEGASSAENAPKKDDWLDWDGKGGNSDISDEIEKELHNMPSTVTPSRSDIVKTSPTMHSTGDKGALKVKGKTSKSNKPNAIDTDLSPNIPHSEPNQPSPSKTKRSPSKTNTTIKSHAVKTTNQQPWEDLDIKNINISVQRSISSEFDFFADMKPKLEPVSKALEIGKLDEKIDVCDAKSPNLQIMEVHNSPRNVNEKSSLDVEGEGSKVKDTCPAGAKGATISFGVIDSTAEVQGAGWGDDFDDWGNDD